ncbi:unnamed protein product, partial [Penicillium discolor]
MTYSVAVSGASGYAGGEILRLLAAHPDVEIRTVTAHSNAGQPLVAHQPHLRSLAHLTLQDTTPEVLAGHDIVFLALPHGQSGQYTDALGDTPLVIDAGADHRLTSSAEWDAFYGGSFHEPWTYGVPELLVGGGKQRETLRSATRIAAPGCNASTRDPRLREPLCRRRHAPPHPGDPSGARRRPPFDGLRRFDRLRDPGSRDPGHPDLFHPGPRADVARHPRHVHGADRRGCERRRDPSGVGERLRRRDLRPAAAGGELPAHGRRARGEHSPPRPRDRPRREPRHGGHRRRQPRQGHRRSCRPVHEHRAGASRDPRPLSERSRPVSVTAPAGFEAAGVAAGLKSTGKPDVAVVVNRGPRKVGAAVFTSNRAKANPIIWSQQAVADRVVEAVVLNSG